MNTDAPLPPHRHTFRKRERIVSRKLMETLFARRDGSRQSAAYPLRVVTMERQRDDHEEPLQILISVPKKRLHHAVDRNRAKRQVREAYRQNRQILAEHIGEGRAMAVAFIWVADEPVESQRVESSVKKLLSRMKP